MYTNLKIAKNYHFLPNGVFIYTTFFHCLKQVQQMNLISEVEYQFFKRCQQIISSYPKVAHMCAMDRRRQSYKEVQGL